jgi:hypothetical protein
MNKEVYDGFAQDELIDKYAENLDLKKFLKLLDNQIRNKSPHNTDVFNDLILSSSKNKSDYNKKIKSIHKYEYFEHLLEYDLNILVLVNSNFKKFKRFEIDEEDTAFQINHLFEIIYSKINKNYYVFNTKQIIDIRFVSIHCVKKFKDKTKAIMFIKDKMKTIKKDNKFMEN